MNYSYLRNCLLNVVALTLICGGFSQAANAGVIQTGYLLDEEARAARVDRVEVLLATESVARQLESLGVDKAMVEKRIQALSNSELLLLERQIDEQVAAGDALSIIGAVFLVLLILEVVGATDFFKGV